MYRALPAWQVLRWLFIYEELCLTLCMCMCACVVAVESLSGVQLFVTLQTVARRASLSIEFSRQECWSALPCPIPANLPNPVIEPTSLMSLAFTGRFVTTSAVTCDD